MKALQFPRSDLALRIIRRRKQLHFTADELAREAGVPVRMLADIERGKTTDPRMNSLDKIATALRWTVDELMGRPVKKSARPAAEPMSRAG